jgi:hypothetical protein
MRVTLAGVLLNIVDSESSRKIRVTIAKFVWKLPSICNIVMKVWSISPFNMVLWSTSFYVYIWTAWKEISYCIVVLYWYRTNYGISMEQSWKWSNRFPCDIGTYLSTTLCAISSFLASWEFEICLDANDNKTPGSRVPERLAVGLIVKHIEVEWIEQEENIILDSSVFILCDYYCSCYSWTSINVSRCKVFLI